MSFVKGFLVSFVLSFLAFAVVILYGGSFALSLVKEDEDIEQDEMQDESEGEGSQAQPVYTSHETFSFALVITDAFTDYGKDRPGSESRKVIKSVSGEQNAVKTLDDRDNESDIPQLLGYGDDYDDLLDKYEKYPKYSIKFICVVSINATVSKTLITVIPGDLMVSIGDTPIDLTYANYFSENSDLVLEDFIPSTVIANTGIIPDFFGYVDIDDFVKLADELGGVMYNNEKEISTEKKSNGKNITVPTGEIKLDSEMLSALLEYDYKDRYTSSQILIDVSRGMLDGICTKFKPNIITKVREMLEYVDTDFTTADMLRVSSIFFSYENSEKNFLALLGAYERFGNAYLFRSNYAGSIDKFKQYLN